MKVHPVRFVQGSLVFIFLFKCFSLSSQLIVNDQNLRGWEKQPSNPVSFVQGPLIPPMGCGSLKFELSAVNTFPKLRYRDYTETLLSDIKGLSFWTLTEQSTDQENIEAPYIVMYLKRSKFGGQDEFFNLFYFPRYQSGKFLNGHPQSPEQVIKKNVWQQWEALKGVWWLWPSAVAIPVEPDEDPKELDSFEEVLSKLNGGGFVTKLFTASSGPGVSLRIQAGAGTSFPRWDKFIGNVDALSITIGNNTTIYDFEADQFAGGLGNAGANRIICPGTATEIGMDPQPGIEYGWTSEPAGFTSQASKVSVSPDETTTYILTAKVTAGSCINISRVTVTVPIANTGPNQNICHRSHIVRMGKDPIEGHSYEWRFEGNLFSTEANPYPGEFGIYVLKETINSIKCTVTGKVEIKRNENFKTCVLNNTPWWNILQWPRKYLWFFIFIICGLALLIWRVRKRK